MWSCYICLLGHRTFVRKIFFTCPVCCPEVDDRSTKPVKWKFDKARASTHEASPYSNLLPFALLK